MLLQDMFPSKQISERFPDFSLLSLGLDKLPAIKARKGKALFAMGLAVWDVLAARGEVDPSAMGDFVDAQDPDLLWKISEHIGKPTVLDIYYALATTGKAAAKKTICEMLVAHVYDRDIFIADIEFSDPTKPIPKARREYPMTKYKGLGLLGRFVADAERCGRDLGCEKVRLVAATSDHVGLFRQQGFEVANTLAAKVGMQIGVSIPMEMTIME